MTSQLDTIKNKKKQVATSQHDKEASGSPQNITSDATIETDIQGTLLPQAPRTLVEAVNFLYSDEMLQEGLAEIANDLQKLIDSRPIEEEHFQEESTTFENWHDQIPYETIENPHDQADSRSQEDHDQYDNNLSREDINKLVSRPDFSSLLNQYLGYYNL